MALEPGELPVRHSGDIGSHNARPIYAVWELTLHCDQPCQHCGSRAGAQRTDELSTDEVLEVASALAELGCREVALIGGEAYLRKDLPIIIRHLADSGIRVVMQTGGRAFSPERAKALRAAGLTGLGVSIDGPRAIHDELRGNAGSYDAAMRALVNARDAGMVISANTQINRLNHRLLRPLSDTLRAQGIQSWQVQLTVPMGRAADRPDWILAPWMVVDVIDTLAAIQLEAAREHREGPPFTVFCGNNVGYFGPHEQTLRSRPGAYEAHWQGCRAGISTIGIESDGTVKACPSLPTAPYDGGNVRSLSLAALWQRSDAIRFARDRTSDELWGHCRDCYYADICRGGCSWMAHCTLGRRGNNPFCYYRVKQLQRRGLRERLVLRQRAPERPYDFGRYEIVEEPWRDDDDEAAVPPAPARRLPVLD